jgi:DNA-binding NtrC family response regulator
MPLPSRVLIVEDEFLIASDFQMVLKRAGVSDVRLTGEIRDAIELIEAEPWDAAVLDGSLHGRSSEPVAITLAERGIPFVVVTGYDTDKLAPALREATVLKKPIRDAALLDSLSLR